MIVSESSSFTRRAAAIFFERLFPAIRSLSSGSGLWIEICTWSSPADFSASARSGVKLTPAVMSDGRARRRVRRRRAGRDRGTASARRRWAPAADQRARLGRRGSMLRLELIAVLLCPMSSGLEQYGQWSGH